MNSLSQLAIVLGITVIVAVAAVVVVAGANQQSERERLVLELLYERCMAVGGVFLRSEQICLRSYAVINVGGGAE